MSPCALVSFQRNTSPSHEYQSSWITSNWNVLAIFLCTRHHILDNILSYNTSVKLKSRNNLLSVNKGPKCSNMTRQISGSVLCYFSLVWSFSTDDRLADTQLHSSMHLITSASTFPTQDSWLSSALHCSAFSVTEGCKQCHTGKDSNTCSTCWMASRQCHVQWRSSMAPNKQANQYCLTWCISVCQQSAGMPGQTLVSYPTVHPITRFWLPSPVVVPLNHFCIGQGHQCTATR